MLSNFYDKTVEVKRLGITTGEKQEYDTLHASVACAIQPDSELIGENRLGAFGKTFIMLCATMDIKENDLVIEGDTTYKVQGVIKHAFAGHDHMELLLNAE